MSGSNGVTCNRCQQSGLGWCVSRSTRKHYLAYLVPTDVARNGQVVSEMRPQPNLLHKCGQTLDQSRQAAAEFAAERARIRALGTSPQPIAAPVTSAPAVKPTRKRASAKSAAAVTQPTERALPVGQSVPFNAGQSLPFKTDGAVKLDSAAVPGAVGSAVILTNALVAKGYARNIAAAIAQTGTPEQVASLLLK